MHLYILCAVHDFVILHVCMKPFSRDLRFNRDDIIMMMNACLSLLVVILSFAFGIDRTQNGFVCRVMGMFLHFFFFASLLWLGCYIMCVSRRLNPPAKDPGEEVINPVLKYYIVSWGNVCREFYRTRFWFVSSLTVM